MRFEAPGLRTYYVLLATQAVSLLGSRVSFFAVGIAVFTKTSQATPLAIISFCQILPRLVGAGFAGALEAALPDHAAAAAAA